MKKLLMLTAFAALLFAGVASAHIIGTLWLKPGHCTKIAKTKVCARKAAPRTVTHISTVTSTVTKTVTQTVTQTVTAPAPCTVTKSYSGQATTGTLEPEFTTCQNEVITVTATDGYIAHVVDEVTGTHYASNYAPTVLPPGKHQFFIDDIGTPGSWTVSVGQ